MIILVCGGRNYERVELIYAALTALHLTRKVEMVIHGGARGADGVASLWAQDKRIHEAPVLPMWRTGLNAGPRRNAAMLLLRPALVVAFPGGRGTANMVHQAEQAGVPVWRAITADGEVNGAGLVARLEEAER